MRAFSVIQKRPKIAKMVITGPLKKTEQNTLSLLKFIIFVDLERINEFHGNITITVKSLYLRLHIGERRGGFG